jgi:hypothetical protein
VNILSLNKRRALDRQRELRLHRLRMAVATIATAAGVLSHLVERLRADAEYLDLMQDADTAAVAADVVRAQAMVLSGLCLDFAKEDEHARIDDAQRVRRHLADLDSGPGR